MKLRLRTMKTAPALGALAISLLTAGTASAQKTAEASASEAGSDEIIVTARKRAEDVQTVPIAITALSAQDLAERNISNFNDLANATPGVAITSISGGNVQNIYLRGLAPANTANDLNVEANVGVFIDGIYQTSRNTLDIISVLDVGQIAVAKGPQSALFGRSTFAGAVAISTRQPAQNLEGSVSATVGTDEDYRIRGTISAPLTETLSVRLAAGYLTYDGFGKNRADRRDNLGGTEKYAVTAALLFEPSPNFTARLSGFLTRSSNELSPGSVLPIAVFNCGNGSFLYCGKLSTGKVSDVTADAPETVAKNRQISLELTGRLDGVEVTSLTGFTAAENRAFNDYDGSSAGTVFGVCTAGAACVGTPAYSRLVRVNLLSSSAERVRTFSQEIRLQSDNKSPFQWIFGSNYFDSRIPITSGGLGTDRVGLAANERFVQVSQLTTPAATGNGAYDFTANPFIVANALDQQLFGSYSRSGTRNFSIFGSLGYDFGDLRLTAEGRYNIDRKRARVFSVLNPLSQPGINQPVNGTSVPAVGVFPVAGPPFVRTFSSFAPRFTVDYEPAPGLFLYASAAKGVRSGGFNTANPVSPTGILAGEVAYEEETNWTYEAGFKSRIFDDRLMLNASIFHVDWANAQVSAFTENPTTVNPVRIVRNAGNIKANGFEAQAELDVTEMFSIGGNVVYSDPKFQKGAYDASSIPQCVVGTGQAAIAAAGCPPVIVITTANGAQRAVPSLAGLRTQRSVKLQWNLHATADVPVSQDWRLTGRIDVSHTGSAYSNLVNTISFGARTLTSARIAFESDRYSLALWGNNLFDVNYVSNSINQPRAGFPFAYSVPEIYLGERRRIGITGTAKF